MYLGAVLPGEATEQHISVNFTESSLIWNIGQFFTIWFLLGMTEIDSAKRFVGTVLAVAYLLLRTRCTAMVNAGWLGKEKGDPDQDVV
jgi:hypothetical protein